MDKTELKLYPKTDEFEVIGSVCIPHTFNKNNSGICETCRMSVERALQPQVLPQTEHKCQIIIKVKKGDLEKSDTKKSLAEYLKKVKPISDKYGYEGFTFTK
jgi:hypothetical protein